MREVHVDLSNEQCPLYIFSGYIGEHNETKLIIKLPNRMLTQDVTDYQFVFRNSQNEIQSDNVVDSSDIQNGNISTMLTENQTTDNSLLLSVVAIVKEGGIISRKAKTRMISLRLDDGV